MTDFNDDGLAAEVHGGRVNSAQKGLSRVAVAGVGAAVMVAWLSMSAKFVDFDALKAGVAHARTQVPQQEPVATAAAGSEARQTGSVPRHAALFDRADLAHAGAAVRERRVEPAESHIFAQPEALTQQAFTRRFETGNTVVASLEPRAERFGGTVPAMEDAPLRAALEARKAEFGAQGAEVLEAALDPDAFVLPQDVPVPTGRPRVTVAKAVAKTPAPATASVEKPAAPSNALVAVVESLPSVTSLVQRVKLPQAAKPSEKPKPVVTAKAPKKKSKSRALAYATPGLDDGDKGKGGGLLANLFGDSPKKGVLPGRGSGVAIYDISAAVVHMPNGEKLEAHSGLGHMKDNPKYADRRMKGPTPPNVYNLRMRESLYHGVEAIRMLPTDHKRMRGRDGILAHSNLVRGTNGSHGCVAFKDYNKFLKAFKRGEVKKIVVVPRMSEAKTYLAML